MLAADADGQASPDGVRAGRDPAPDIGALLKKAEDEAAELKDAWLRARADTENVRKQGANDVARAHKYAIENFADELLPVKDALESTLAASDAAPRGAEARRRAHAEAARRGVRQGAGRRDRSRRAQKFDPHRHQAMTMVDSDAAAEHRRPGLPEGLPAQRPRAAPGAGRRVAEGSRTTPA